MLNVPPLSGLGTPVELVTGSGKRDDYLKAVRLLEGALYKSQGNDNAPDRT